MLSRHDASRDMLPAEPGAAMPPPGCLGAETALQADADCVLASIGDALVTTDLTGRITYLNPVAVRLTGWSADDAVGQLLEAVLPLISESTRLPVANTAVRCLAEGRSVDLEEGVILVRRDGTEVPIGDSAAPVRDSTGDTVGVVLVIQDEGEKRRVGHRLTHEANHDGLTGLVNRREFDRRLARVVADQNAHPSDPALVLLDLDRFKAVNDGGGHEAGDALLRDLGPLLSRHLRQGDTLARLGGDEFGLLLENCPLVDAERIAESLRSTIEQHRHEWEDKAYTISASLGLIPILPAWRDVSEVLRAADAACYEAKAAGGNRVHVERMGQDATRRAPALARRVTRLARAADEGHFLLYAQPIVALRPGRPERLRLEVLLRLPDGHGGVQVAADFLPQAARHHLMPAIDRWVVRETIAQLGQWHQGHPGAEWPLCSINLSASALAGDTLLPVIEAQLARHSIPAATLCFEIEESDALGDVARTARFIEGIQAAGCKVALDNFGSGISSFGFLRSLRVDSVKIGAPLVHGVVADALSGSIVSAIHRIGESLGIDTVATQVGTTPVLRQLDVLGLGYAQGLALGEPVPLTDADGELPARFQQMGG